ncbi:uncharacterized protein LOC112693403 [Sipha flava]|uniref:Uncharacterized protein LOC112693403 n=1 Tax=Sipha flava TaxID=143950 RepID=A0A2S2R2N9_9HEMI|nr:uncharacterized protein LOC112693403 [Sipha flava]
MLRLIMNAEYMLENKDNNICEQINSIINKHVASKRINFSSRGNYNTRVEAAVVSFNSKQFLRKLHKKMTNNISPETRIIKKSRTENGSDEDYGLAEPLVEELSLEMFEKKKSITCFIKKLKSG